MKISSLKGLFLVCLSTLIVCQGVEAQAKKEDNHPSQKDCCKASSKKAGCQHTGARCQCCPHAGRYSKACSTATAQGSICI